MTLHDWWWVLVCGGLGVITGVFVMLRWGTDSNAGNSLVPSFGIGCLLGPAIALVGLVLGLVLCALRVVVKISI